MKRPAEAVPCITRARALLEANDPAVRDLEATIAAVEAHAAEAEATITRLDRERPDVIAAGSRADLAAHDERTADAGFARDQSLEIAARLKAALVPARAAARHAQASAAREKTETLVAKAVAALADYPEAARAVLGILGIVAHADLAAAEFARSFPEETPITGAESRVRWTASSTTKGEPVRGWAWATEDGRILDRDASSPRVLPDDRTVRTDDGSPGLLIFPANAALLVNGHPRPSGRGDGSTIDTPWYQRDFLAEIAEHHIAPSASYVFRLHNGPRVYPVEVLRTPTETLPADRPAPLAETVILPALKAGDIGWTGFDGSAADVLAALATPPVDTRRPTRKVEVEQVVETGRLMTLLSSAGPAPVPHARLAERPQPQEFAIDARRIVEAVA